ncbi:MAG TPA: GtrA family protein [Candidatus Paceibacterota bacterium]|nr:GtrA family protein [Candidatus Paceibacterota bacterium]
MAYRERNEKTPFLEYVRFGTAGVLNTVTDFIVLNSLLTLSAWNGTEAGIYVACKAISFGVAVTQSYFLNKYWVFGAPKSQLSRAEEGGRFFAVSAAGFLLNIVGSSIILSILGAMNLFDPRLRANAGAAAGTLLVLAWNYAGYKFFVFKEARAAAK